MKKNTLFGLCLWALSTALCAQAQTLQQVTDNGATTINNITVGGLTANGSIVTNGIIGFMLNNPVINDFRLTGAGQFRVVDQANSKALLLITNGGTAIFDGDLSATNGLYITGGDNSSNTTIADFKLRNNTSALYIQGGGNVGVGTISPSSKLEVQGGNGLKIRAGDTGVGTQILRAMRIDDQPALEIRGDGNVGIGTFTPQTPLHIKNVTPTINLEKASGLNWALGNINGNDFYIRADNTMSSPFMIEAGTGNVGVGTAMPKEKLSVNGKIRAKEIKVETNNWPDYVFEQHYELPSLAATEAFVKANKHLPEVPSASEVANNGVELGEMNKILLKKIEELTLHMIEKEKQINTLQQQYLELRKMMEKPTGGARN